MDIKRGFKTRKEAEDFQLTLLNADLYEVIELRAGGEFEWMSGEAIGFYLEYIGD